MSSASCIINQLTRRSGWSPSEAPAAAAAGAAPAAFGVALIASGSKRSWGSSCPRRSGRWWVRGRVLGDVPAARPPPAAADLRRPLTCSGRSRQTRLPWPTPRPSLRPGRSVAGGRLAAPAVPRRMAAVASPAAAAAAASASVSASASAAAAIFAVLFPPLRQVVGARPLAGRRARREAAAGHWYPSEAAAAAAAAVFGVCVVLHSSRCGCPGSLALACFRHFFSPVFLPYLTRRGSSSVRAADMLFCPTYLFPLAGTSRIKLAASPDIDCRHVLGGLPAGFPRRSRGLAVFAAHGAGQRRGTGDEALVGEVVFVTAMPWTDVPAPARSRNCRYCGQCCQVPDLQRCQISEVFGKICQAVHTNSSLGSSKGARQYINFEQLGASSARNSNLAPQEPGWQR